MGVEGGINGRSPFGGLELHPNQGASLTLIGLELHPNQGAGLDGAEDLEGVEF